MFLAGLLVVLCRCFHRKILRPSRLSSRRYHLAYNLELQIDTWTLALQLFALVESFWHSWHMKTDAWNAFRYKYLAHISLNITEATEHLERDLLVKIETSKQSRSFLFDFSSQFSWSVAWREENSLKVARTISSWWFRAHDSLNESTHTSHSAYKNREKIPPGTAAKMHQRSTKCYIIRPEQRVAAVPNKSLNLF